MCELLRAGRAPAEIVAEHAATHGGSSMATDTPPPGRGAGDAGRT
jgi:hypothetical protein